MSVSNAMFSSRFGFLMAAVGFAVGLGNIWRFPYLTGENGGGAFVVVYLLCVLIIGVPIIMAELLIGRRGRLSPPRALVAVATAEGASARWGWLGSLNVFAAFLIVGVYAVVVGWVLRYLFLAITNNFAAINIFGAASLFEETLANTGMSLLWTSVGLVVTGVIMVGGVQRGIERSVRVLMPMLFVLLVLLALYNVFAGGFSQALQYLFVPDFSLVTPSLVLVAVGQAFFSIGVAMAGMMTFGAYLPSDISIPRSAVIIALGDTLVALLAGLVIFPAVFHNGLDPADGTGLIFQTLPVAFAQMPGGYAVAVFFFLLLSVAAITSMLGLIEPIIAWLCETMQWQRARASVVALAGVTCLSIISVLSNSGWSQARAFGLSLSQLLDFLPNQLLLPIGGMLIAVFAGWRMSANASSQELALADDSLLFRTWRVLVRFFVPLVIGVIFVAGLTD